MLIMLLKECAKHINLWYQVDTIVHQLIRSPECDMESQVNDHVESHAVAWSVSSLSLLFAVPEEPFRVSPTAKWTAYLQEVSPFQCSTTNSFVNFPVPWPPSQISTIFLTMTSDRGLRTSVGWLGYANHDQPSAPAFAICNTPTRDTSKKQSKSKDANYYKVLIERSPLVVYVSL